MSRFGIRNKLKDILGLGKGPEVSTCSITFVLPDGTERPLQVEKHYSILMAADANGLTISTGRRAGGTCPDGGCGSCRLETLDATGLSKMSEHEELTIEAHVRGDPHDGRAREPGPPREPSHRLGCHTKILDSGARIQIAALFDPDSIRGD
ncbi:MAG TPA: hypothetical protein QGF58_01170 [Myxococcota bacterium]|nr:hypothetical protein [Myxococcota bacterium]